MDINTGETIGLKRKIDPLGRIVLPIEFRKELKMNVSDEVQMFLLKDGIFVKVKEGKRCLKRKNKEF